METKGKKNANKYQTTFGGHRRENIEAFRAVKNIATEKSFKTATFSLKDIVHQ